MEDQINNKIKKILGDSALKSNQMQVPTNVVKLTKAVRYLVTQLKVTSSMVKTDVDIEDQIDDHVKGVLKNVELILG